MPQMWNYPGGGTQVAAKAQSGRKPRLTDSARRGFSYVALVADADFRSDLEMDNEEECQKFSEKRRQDIEAALTWISKQSK